MFPIQNGLKQGDALSPLLFNFSLEYTIRSGQENQEEMKSDGKHLLLAYTNDVNIEGENIVALKKNTEALLDSSKEVGLEENPEKTKYVLISHSQKIGPKHSIKIVKSFADVANFKYLGTTLIDKNCMYEVIKSRLSLGNTCYHSVQNLLSSCLLSRLKYTKP
jgi:hypothetical protein